MKSRSSPAPSVIVIHNTVRAAHSQNTISVTTVKAEALSLALIIRIRSYTRLSPAPMPSARRNAFACSITEISIGAI